MRELGWGAHVLILVALIVNLWVGGDYVEAWAGRSLRGAFEIGLILAYMTLVIGMRAPLRWRRGDPGRADQATDDGERRE